MLRRFLGILGLLVTGLMAVLPAGAETIAPADFPRVIARDVANLFTTHENLVIAAAGAAATWAGTSVEDRIVDSRFNSEFREETTLDHVFEAGYYLGGPLQIGGAVATYGFGLTGHPEAQALGADLIRAQFISGGITLGLKEAVGRERPDHSSSTSFPSGHASSAFATATVIHRRYGPRAGLASYLLAGYVAVSRLNESQHYLSDIIAGAALGIMVGRTVTRDHDDGRLGIHPTVSPRGVGIRFVYRPDARAPSPVAYSAAVR